MKPLLITIDGPAGAGKSTVSKILAEKLGYRYLDTGALYRAVALKVIESKIAPDNDEKLAGLFRNIRLKFVQTETGTHLYCDGEDITQHIRTEEVSMMASEISANPVVRKSLLQIQREACRDKKVVAEGRDMGTVVFVDADIKFFLDASAKTRARRRYLEIGPGSSSTLEHVENQMRQRDKNDSFRQLAPLKAAYDAIRIDSTELSIEAVVDLMLNYIFERFSK